MAAWVWIVIAVAVVAAVLLVWLGIEQSRRRRLRQTFGPEYDRALERGASRREVETELQGRVRRRRALEIRPLEPGAREQYAQAWSRAQARFVDEPAQAVRDADMLVIDVMGRRGYPMADFDERAGDISVDHPDIVEDYRHAHGVSRSLDDGRASTEDMRQAMVHYRALFARLLEAEPAQQRAAQAVPGPDEQRRG